MSGEILFIFLLIICALLYLYELTEYYKKFRTTNNFWIYEKAKLKKYLCEYKLLENCTSTATI